MSRLKIATPNKAQLTVERLYKDLERRIIASPPGLCPVDLQLSFLKMCHAQTCGKCVPCRVGLGQLQNLMEDVLAGKATLKTLDLIRDTASDIVDSADCAIGYEAAHMVLAGLEGFREDYVYHIEHGGKCSCHITQPVPCVALCPAGVDIPGYIALVKEGRYADAVKLIRKDNPFPTACALICEHPCEARCRRNMIDSAINIRGLKRMAVDNARANTVPVPEKAESTGKKVAIIGGGPGGLSAAYYLELMGHHAVVFEEKSKLGGMLRYGIPNYRFPRERLQEDIDTILSTGVEVKLNTRVGNGEGEISYNKLHEEYDAVYIAIGAHTDKVGIEERMPTVVMSAVEMLRRIGDDDMPDFKDKTVVVVGGGNVAMDCTRSAIRLGAKKGELLLRRRQTDMTALPEEVEGAIAAAQSFYSLKAPHRSRSRRERQCDGSVGGTNRRSSFHRCLGISRPIQADVPLLRIPCDIVVVAIGQGIGPAISRRVSP